MKQFIFGLGVALVCGTTAAAEGFWVCKVDWPRGAVINLHADRMVLFDGDESLDSICSNNVCIGRQGNGEDDATYRIFNVDYFEGKPFSMLYTRVDVGNQKLDGIATEEKATLLSQCTKF